MYVYVYIKLLKSFEFVRSTQISDFEYEAIGHQSKKLRSKPFKCCIKKKSYICQILTVADTEEELNEFINETRPRVPKLNESDLVVEDDEEETTEKETLKQSRKKGKAKAKKSEQDVITGIVDQYQLALGEPYDSTIREEDSDTELIDPRPSKKKNTDHDYTHDPVDPRPSKKRMIESVNNGSYDEEANDKSDSENNVVSELKRKLLEERRQRLKAVEAVNVLREQNDKRKRQNEEEEHEQEADKAEVAAKERQREIKGFPKIIKTHSGIRVKKAAVEEAYSAKEPSRFYINMMYAAWGRSLLSQRCIKKTKKTKDIQTLSPKKKRAVREHFEHFLHHYNFPENLYGHYLGLMNNFARRAINGAKSHVKLLADYPELGSNNDEDPDMIEL